MDHKPVAILKIIDEAIRAIKSVWMHVTNILDVRVHHFTTMFGHVVIFPDLLIDRNVALSWPSDPISQCTFQPVYAFMPLLRHFS